MQKISGVEKVKVFLLFSKYILGICIFFYFSGVARAEGFDIGMFKLYPTIKIEERFEDNIYLLPDNKESDFITTVTPELDFQGKCTGDNSFNLNYKYNMFFFKDIKESDSRTHDININLRFAGANHFLKIGENFQQTASPTSYAASYSDYSLNTATFGFGADYNQLSYAVNLQNLEHEYQEIDSLNSRNETITTITGYYKFFPKTKALAEYKYGNIDYKEDKTKKVHYNEFLAGVEGKLSQKLTGIFKIGYQDRSYLTKEDWRKPVTYADVSYEISDKTTLQTQVTRSSAESAYTVENYYEINKAVSTLTQKLTKKTSVSIIGGYEYYRYPAATAATARRRDNLWNLKLALDITSRKWFAWGAKYEFKKRDSNIVSSDYENNITSIYLKAIF